jgi:hypothetical protein
MRRNEQQSDLRQVAEDGRTVPMKLNNETWNELHKQARDIGATTIPGTEDELIKLYINSFDKSVIGVEVARKLFKTSQTWAITYTNHSEQVLGTLYDQQKQSFSQFGTANTAAPVPLPDNAKRPRLDSPAPAPPRQPCKFCLSTGHSVDVCYKISAYLKENQTAIDTWCATRKGISSTPKVAVPRVVILRVVIPRVATAIRSEDSMSTLPMASSPMTLQIRPLPTVCQECLSTICGHS